jgi:GNAT superfamily N-acetyltransferase
MEAIEYVRATAADIPILLEMRRAFSHELVGKQTDELEHALDVSQTDYFSRELNKNYFCWYATVNGDVASIAGMTLRVQPGNIKNPSGRWGYLMLVYTKPAYRKRGLSGKIIQRLVATAKELDLNALELHATPEGEPVYVREGFIHFNEPTYRMYF